MLDSYVIRSRSGLLLAEYEYPSNSKLTHQPTQKSGSSLFLLAQSVLWSTSAAVATAHTHILDGTESVTAETVSDIPSGTGRLAFDRPVLMAVGRFPQSISAIEPLPARCGPSRTRYQRSPPGPRGAGVDVVVVTTPPEGPSTPRFPASVTPSGNDITEPTDTPLSGSRLRHRDSVQRLSTGRPSVPRTESPTLGPLPAPRRTHKRSCWLRR